MQELSRQSDEAQEGEAMRICWYSNACHIPSGYGMQTAQVLHRLAKDGNEVALTANHGAAVMMNCAHGHPIFPEGLIRYSVDAAPDNMRGWIGDEPGFGVILFDLWPLLGVQGFNDLNLACWTPIDHDPAPPLVAKFLLDGKHHGIAMSRFGEDRLLKAGVPRDELTYIPHAIDMSVFKDNGKGAREAMGIPEDAFLVITNAANRGRIPVRKGFGEMADVMARLMADRPDVYWMIHTEPQGLSEGVNLPRLMQATGVDSQRVRYPNPIQFRNGIPQDAEAHTMEQEQYLTQILEHIPSKLQSLMPMSQKQMLFQVEARLYHQHQLMLETNLFDQLSLQYQSKFFNQESQQVDK